jgi:hypothetical protein
MRWDTISCGATRNMFRNNIADYIRSDLFTLRVNLIKKNLMSQMVDKNTFHSLKEGLQYNKNLIKERNIMKDR